MKIMLDTDVLIDALQRREPWRADAEKIVYFAANRQIHACISAKQLTDIHYFSKKILKGEPQADEQARRIIEMLMALFETVDTQAADCKNAITISNGDYEDAVLISTAVRTHCDYIVTRNTDHFSSGKINALTPSEIVLILEKN